MKKTAVVVLSGLVIVSFTQDSLATSEVVRLERIDVNVNGGPNVAVWREGYQEFSVPDELSCSDNKGALVFSLLDDGNREMFTVLLAAHLSGKQVQVLRPSSCLGSWPKLERAGILRQ